MKSYQVTASRIIEAPAELVYKTLADYRQGHPSILPKAYFLSLEVEEGGFGAGTVINCRMKVLGQIRSFRAVITEPEPGRELVETELGEGGVVTTFIVEALDELRTRVTIATKGAALQGGVAGSVERFITKTILARVYKEELKQLARVCEGAPASGVKTG